MSSPNVCLQPASDSAAMAPTASAIDVGRIPSFTFTPGSGHALYQGHRVILVVHQLARRRFPGGHSALMSETLPPTPTDSEPEDMTRRNFIEHVGFMSGTALLYAACKPSEPKKSETTVPIAPQTAHRAFSSEEYDTMSAVVERICPRDEEPGAIDLGVPEYIDRALATPTLSHVRDDFVRGTEVLMRRARGRHQKAFAALSPGEQDQLLTEFKESPAGTGEQHYWTVLIGVTM